jgi:lipopolysaccharide transport system ATP-binding protein
LAFSIAVHATPDVLLVDEVLSVGDAGFQVRCMERIHELRASGVSLVFVSHFLGLIVDACERAIFLDKGHLQFLGPSQEAANRYQNAVRATEASHMGATPMGTGAREGSFDVEITSVGLLDRQGQERNVWHMGQSMTVRIVYLAHRPVTEAVFGVEITRNDGLDCFATNTAWDGLSTGQIDGPGTVELHIPRVQLTAGVYYLGVGILERTGTAFLDFHDKAYRFEVHTDRRHRGAIHLEHVWQVTPVLPPTRGRE